MTTKWFAVLAVNLVLASSARADGEVANDAGIELAVAVTTAERPVRPQKPERPDRPIKENSGQEVKELVSDFRTKMAEFHAEQKELVKRLKSASEEERSNIREQMKSNREEFNSLKDEFRDSIKDLTGALKDHAVKVSAEVKAENKGGKIRK
jgi:Skp family chaperone for outer membrane proteins